VVHGVFDPAPRDTDVSERAIVELMELADGAAQEPFMSEVTRQPSGPPAESAEPLRQPAHDAAHAGFDDECVETGLPLGLQEQGQRQGIISIEHGGSAGDRFSQQFRGRSAEQGCPETEARKLFIVELSEPHPYALLAWVVREPDQPCAPGSIWLSAVWSGARPYLRAKTGWFIDSLLISLKRRAHVRTRLAHQPDASST
jgi:hypothetical protein